MDKKLERAFVEEAANLGKDIDFEAFIKDERKVKMLVTLAFRLGTLDDLLKMWINKFGVNPPKAIIELVDLYTEAQAALLTGPPEGSDLDAEWEKFYDSVLAIAGDVFTNTLPTMDLPESMREEKVDEEASDTVAAPDSDAESGGSSSEGSGVSEEHGSESSEEVPPVSE